MERKHDDTLARTIAELDADRAATEIPVAGSLLTRLRAAIVAEERRAEAMQLRDDLTFEACVGAANAASSLLAVLDRLAKDPAHRPHRSARLMPALMFRLFRKYGRMLSVRLDNRVYVGATEITDLLDPTAAAVDVSEAIEQRLADKGAVR